MKAGRVMGRGTVLYSKGGKSRSLMIHEKGVL